ncbi:D-sedoheptulose-7-phosphate isomerase [Silvibacterium acidisoli]|uniref:D-sedoheptulose-7-phosphate isomerase n=1 Tax=Acidobacteriaceae bacterium ZG23-2 TaxID=2883246 RepID=UPI00406CFE53
MKNSVGSYFDSLYDAINSTIYTDHTGAVIDRGDAYEAALRLADDAITAGNRLMFIGNGGSAGIASHMAIDFSKNGKMPAMAFNDGAALTCLANDYGYEEVFSRQIEFHARRGDVLVAISSSGKSPNILNAVATARSMSCKVITFSGFDADNPLRAMGDVNFYVGNHQYGMVEVAHTALAHAIVDLKCAGVLNAAAKSLV